MFIVQYIAPRNSDLSSFFSFLGEIHGLFGPFFIFAHISPLLHPIFPASHHHHPRPHVEREEEYWGKGMFLGCASAETSTRQKWGRETTSAPSLQIITYSAVAATNAQEHVCFQQLLKKKGPFMQENAASNDLGEKMCFFFKGFLSFCPRFVTCFACVIAE